MTANPLATRATAAARSELDARVADWLAHHASLWASVCDVWAADGHAPLTLSSDEGADGAPVVVDGASVAWLSTDERVTDTQRRWLQIVAELIGTAISRETELETMTDELVDTYDQLTFLYETTRTLSTTDTLPDALRRVLIQARHIVGAAGSAFILAQPGEDLLLLTDGVVPDAAFLMRAHSTMTRADHAVVANTVTAVRDMLGSGDAFATRDHGIASMVVAPIQTSAGAASAACYGATKLGGFTAGNRRLMQAVVEQSITIVTRFALQEEQIRRGRIARDLELASQIQTALLPAAFPGAAHLSLAARILPASEVGGDFYIHPDRDVPADAPFVIGVGDVAGKGVAAALITTMCLSALRAEVRHAASPAAALQAMQGTIASELDRIGSFVTCALAAYIHESHALRYASAGHNPPLLWHAKVGVIEELPATGLPIGVDVGMEISDVLVPFHPGDVLLLYTDGVTEAMTADGAQFGIERLRETLIRVASEPPMVIEAAIIAAIHAFAPKQRDDITLVVLKAEG